MGAQSTGGIPALFLVKGQSEQVIERGRLQLDGESVLSLKQESVSNSRVVAD